MQDNSTFGVVFLHGTKPTLISEKTKVKEWKKHKKNIAKHGLNQEKYCNFVEKDNETKT